MSSDPPVQRYPKRKRTQSSYKVYDDVEEMGDNATCLTHIKNDPDDDVDWKTAAKKISTSKKRKKERRKAIKKSIFPFMSLPPELRNSIYKLCLQAPRRTVKLSLQGIQPNCSRKRLMQGIDVYDRIVLAQESIQNHDLLLTSKVIYQEAIGFVYNQQKFIFKNLPSMWTFLSPLSSETKSLLRNLEVHLCRAEWNFLPAISRDLPVQGSLERLAINNLAGHVGVGNPTKYLNATGREGDGWSITLPNFDTITGIVLAKSVYDFLYPIIRRYAQEKSVADFVDLLHLFDTKPKLDYKFWRVERRFAKFDLEPWTKDRAATVRQVMIEELEDIISEDDVPY